MSKQIGAEFGFAIPAGKAETIVARRTGELTDLQLCISPSQVGVKLAARNLAKAINLALEADFIETPLDGLYRAARVRNGKITVYHDDYFGLGDGLMASLGKTVKSFTLTLKGPDPVSTEGKKWVKQNGGGSLSGVLNLIARKLNLLQEFEDEVPTYVQQMLDRLEARKIVTHWNRDEWKVETTTIGLDVILTPVTPMNEKS